MSAGDRIGAISFENEAKYPKMDENVCYWSKMGASVENGRFFENAVALC